VAAILAACAGRAALPDDVRPLARLLTVLVGVTPRAVLAALGPGKARREAAFTPSLPRRLCTWRRSFE
jgi:hypothetical protein